MKHLDRMKYVKGAIIEMQFDTGCMGYRTLYGRVIAAGEKAFRVVWESGLTNRLTYARHDHLVRFAQDTATAEDAMSKVTA